MASFYVYVLFRPDGTPCYVGKGKGRRWRDHFTRSNNIHLARIIAKSGRDLPAIKVREHLSEADAIATERALIAAIGRELVGGPLVNLTDGGEGVAGLVISPAQRAQLSEQAKKRMSDPLVRARLSELVSARWRTREAAEAREALASRNKARVLTDAQRAAMGERSKLRWLASSAFRDKVMKALAKARSDPAKQAKRIAALKGRKVGVAGRLAIAAAAKIRMERDPLWKATLKEARTAYWANPENVAKHAERMRTQPRYKHKTPRSPEYRKALSDAAKARMQDPKVRENLAIKARARMAALRTSTNG